MLLSYMTPAIDYRLTLPWQVLHVYQTVHVQGGYLLISNNKTRATSVYLLTAPAISYSGVINILLNKDIHGSKFTIYRYFILLQFLFSFADKKINVCGKYIQYLFYWIQWSNRLRECETFTFTKALVSALRWPFQHINQKGISIQKVSSFYLALLCPFN